MGMQWFVIDNPDGHRLPKWQRSAAVDDAGTVFAPAAIAGNEQSIFFCASWDGVPGVASRKHIFLPVEWLAREYPLTRDLCASIERGVREAQAVAAAE